MFMLLQPGVDVGPYGHYGPYGLPYGQALIFAIFSLRLAPSLQVITNRKMKILAKNRRRCSQSIYIPASANAVSANNLISE
jgi:hypothetical protein